MRPKPATADLEAVLERNPASPLFARLAERLLKSGEITRAISLCERGLELFPGYTTGHLIHARCLGARSEYRSAIDSIDRVIGRYPGNIILADIRLDWEELEGDGAARSGEPTETADAEDGSFPDGAFVLPGPDEPGVEAEAVEAVVDAGPEELTADLPVERGTVPPAAAMPAPQPASEKTLTGFIVENRIVSRTLAEIYARQGALQEAVNTYRLLVAAVPGKREMYQERLRELEERLRSDPGLTSHEPE